MERLLAAATLTVTLSDGNPLRRHQPHIKGDLMGLDMRIFPDDRLDAIESALTSAGFDVTVTKREIEVPDDLPSHIAVTMPDHPTTIHEITVSDGTNSIVLSYGVDEGKFGGFRIYIPNLGAWRPRRNRELHDFQSQVTNVLESVGAYWPFPEDGG